MSGSTTADRIVEALRTVTDPCCREKGISVIDIGLVDRIDVQHRAARITLVLTSGWCPFAVDLVSTVRHTVAALPDVDDAEVEVAWDTPWATARLSPQAHAKLRFLPEPITIADRDIYLAGITGGPEPKGTSR